MQGCTASTVDQENIGQQTVASSKHRLDKRDEGRIIIVRRGTVLCCECSTLLYSMCQPQVNAAVVTIN
jgi:hypothetical protein